MRSVTLMQDRNVLVSPNLVLVLVPVRWAACSLAAKVYDRRPGRLVGHVSVLPRKDRCGFWALEQGPHCSSKDRPLFSLINCKSFGIKASAK